jgi:hypothetical protein
MATTKQELGKHGEALVCTHCACPRCKRKKTLKRLPPNFKCADVICDFCGYLAQVKARRTKQIDLLPKTILGAAWSVQKERMDAGIYFPLFLVQVHPDNAFSIFYLAADLQSPSIFIPRKPLSLKARRAGWQGFTYDIGEYHGSFVRIQ